QEGGRSRPSLRRTRGRVPRWNLANSAPETAEELRKPTQLQTGGGLKQACQNLRRKLGKPVAAHPGRDDGVVMGPDRPIVVRHWVIARFPVGDRTNAPPGIEAVGQKAPSDSMSPLIADDSAKKRMSG